MYVISNSQIPVSSMSTTNKARLCNVFYTQNTFEIKLGGYIHEYVLLDENPPCNYA